jgi:hypothetical protein
MPISLTKDQRKLLSDITLKPARSLRPPPAQRWKTSPSTSTSTVPT